jgi:hypothetical protein
MKNMAKPISTVVENANTPVGINVWSADGSKQLPVLSASGLARRLGPITEKITKALVEVAGPSGVAGELAAIAYILTNLYGFVGDAG